MKKRTGFVSNSSSSSFICVACGREEGGFDASISDFDMVCCENDHTFCIECAVNTDQPCVVEYTHWKTGELIHEEYTSLDDYRENSENENELPKIYCPACQMKSIPSDELMTYLIKKHYGGEVSKAEDEIRETFKEYNAFLAYINTKE